MVQNNLLNALYYPFADVIRSEDLLVNCLYFDTIYVLEPNFFQAPRSRAFTGVPSSQSMRSLTREKVVRPIGPDLLGLNTDFGSGPAIIDEENVALIKDSIRSDMADPQLQKLARDSGISAWEIPTGQQLFWNGLGILLELSNEQDDHSIEVHAGRHDFYSDLLSRANFNRVPVKERVETRVRTPHSELEVRVPFMLAESLMVTVCLLACAEFGLVPITDKRIHHEFLTRKISNPVIRTTLKDGMQSLDLALVESTLARKAIEFHLPRVSDLSAEKVLGLRDRCRDSLESFRIHMRKLRHSVEDNVWSSGFDGDVNRILDTEIAPSVAALKADLTTRAKEFGVKVWEDSVKFAPIPLLTTLTVGYPLELVLPASAGIVVLKDFIQYLVKRGELKKNGLFFLSQLGR
jgi:hypothetical protein